ncbi:hypothetical protein [Nocardia crassostreae]|uniref:hypothetical protein n=1 Tax=Nocardia crassostreae TaxID=53428 RepID=UPI00082E1C82|nr:hypothetical protein [Nocardia crassostreae]
MKRTPHFAAAACAVATAVAPLVFFAPSAAADSATCSGGQLHFATSPIGMNSAPVNGTFNGTVDGCGVKTFHGDFTGTASCWDTQVNINGVLTWDDGQTSTVSGPWHVPGGMAPPPVTNTVPITDGRGAGGSVTVSEAGIDAGAVAGPCMAGSARDLSIQITSLQVN